MTVGEAPGRARTPAAGPALLALGLALLTVGACGADEESLPRVPIGEPAERRAWPAGVAVRVDSGNAAFRAGSYEAARRHYHEAATLAPEVAAAWFGLSMAERALGNESAADSALARAGEMSPAARLHHEAPAGDSGGG